MVIEMFKFSEQSKINMEGIHPDIVMVLKEAIKVSPIDFGVPNSGGLRTSEEQQFHFNTGTSKVDGINKISKHQMQSDGYGHAVDVFAYINGRASWDSRHLALVAGCIISTANRLLKKGKISSRLEWGGNFGSKTMHGWDYPHFEIKKS